MSNVTSDSILQAIATTGQLYHRLVLLVGPSGSDKSHWLTHVAAHLDVNVVNVNLALSELMLDLTPRQRVTRLFDLLGSVISTQIAEKPGIPVLLDNLEILFDTSLHQDPLRLLEKLSRNHSVVASWNGYYGHQKLIYAELGHPEYKVYEAVDAVIVTMETA